MKSALHEYGINHSNEKTPIALTIGVHFFHRLHDQNCNKIITIFVTILEHRHFKDVARKSGVKIVTKLLHFCNIFGAHTFI